MSNHISAVLWNFFKFWKISKKFTKMANIWFDEFFENTSPSSQRAWWQSKSFYFHVWLFSTFLNFLSFFQPNYGNDAYQYASSAKTGRSSNFYNNKEPVEWTNIIPTIDNPRPSHKFRNRFTYTGNFVFYGLTASTEYEVIIQSRNREGWSDASDIFRFSTRDRGKSSYNL